MLTDRRCADDRMDVTPNRQLVPGIYVTACSDLCESNRC